MRKPYLCATAIALLTFFIFSPSLSNDFTNWDDNVYIAHNPLVVNEQVLLIKIFTTPVSLHYHPLTILSLALNYQSGKLAPFGYHLVNVIFHVLNTLLVFFFIFLLTRRNLFMAFIVSLFFGIHPMHVESVAWVSGRKDVLYVFFFMAGLITYQLYYGTKKRAWYFFTLLFFILSCLSKEMAIVFPVILLLMDYLHGAKRDMRLFIEKIPFSLISIIIFITEVKIQSDNTVHYMKFFTLYQRIMLASYSAVAYIVKLFAPFKLSAFYPFPDTNNISLAFYLSPILLMGILISLIYFFIKKKKEIVFGALFYFVSVVMVLQFIPIGPAFIPDRYSYLSYIGLLFVAASFINKIQHSESGILAYLKYPVLIITGLGAVIFSYQSYRRTQVWKNSETLWTNVIKNYPSVSEAYNHRAEYYYTLHENEKVLLDYNKALLIDSTDRDAYYNRGLLYSDYGKNDLAIADYTSAIKLAPEFEYAYTNRGLLYYKSEQYALALNDFKKVITLDSANADAYNNCGSIYFNYGKYDSALKYFNKAITLNPSMQNYRQNLTVTENKIALKDTGKVH
jgi:tetratricopeptide (TPR) repeat protein